ncbi:unnamed protein product [Closterium sp. NIES-65]|nr:unnamed protein product [Closterium sp. NIES-65]
MGREIRKSEEGRVPHAPRSRATQTAAAAATRGGPGGAKIVSAVGFPLVRSSASDGAGATTSAITPAGSAPIKYHGGPVVVGTPTVNIYHIYDGSWGSGSGKDVIVQALSSDSGSQGSAADASVKAWWAITAAYYQKDASGTKNVSSKGSRLILVSCTLFPSPTPRSPSLLLILGCAPHPLSSFS